MDAVFPLINEAKFSKVRLIIFQYLNQRFSVHLEYSPCDSIPLIAKSISLLEGPKRIRRYYG
ncbi:hypothetical protein VIBNIFTn2_120039 [Vibrio nigripulchritudo FTn2]|nr:hypothetical protein VIBNIFTn2_120039 [Vibrio nigripulchritudo FTn2]